MKSLKYIILDGLTERLIHMVCFEDNVQIRQVYLDLLNRVADLRDAAGKSHVAA